jgi:phospholipid/cholesterol/gamma-HCH transport system substrate-binding protein
MAWQQNAQARKRRATLIRLIGFFLVTGTLTFLIGSQIARIDFNGGYHLVGTFDDASGLINGDTVKIAGAPVGQVDSIKVVQGRAEVRVTIQNKYRVPADSELAIKWRNAVGQRVVYLIPGQSTVKIRDGAHVVRTRSVVDVGELINGLAPLTKNLDPQQLNQILQAIYLALEGNKGEFNVLISSVDQLANTIVARKQTLKQLLADFNTVTGVIARRDKQIGDMTDGLVKLSDAFVNNRALVDNSLVQLAGMFRTAQALVGRNGDQLNKVVEGLEVISAGTQRNIGSVSDILKLAAPKLQRLYGVTAANGSFAIGNVPCLTLADGPCPYPAIPKAYKLDSANSLQRAMMGGN